MDTDTNLTTVTNLPKVSAALSGEVLSSGTMNRDSVSVSVCEKKSGLLVCKSMTY